VLPGVVLVLLLVLSTALLGAQLVGVQTLAREAARTAAVTDDDTVRARLAAAIGDRPFEVTITPPAATRRPGELVTVTVRVRSRSGPAPPVWLPATATMLVEDR
jgi:uncharacterized protein YfaS (alpha-2-macroglobulin family)